MKLRHTLRGHLDYIVGIAWSPNGVMLASSSDDKTICIWNTETAKLHMSLTGHIDLVQNVSWSADGKILASCSYDKTIRLWDSQDGKLLKTIEGHNAWVSSVSWSLKEQMFASSSGSNDPNICIWRSPDFELYQKLVGHKSCVFSIAWSPDGQLLASGARDKTIRIWKPQSGELMRVFEGHNQEIISVSWSPSEDIIASGSADNTIRIWDIKKGKQLEIIEGHTESVEGVLFSADGRFLVSQSFDKTIRLWRCDTWEQVGIIYEPTYGIFGGLAFHPQLPLLATRGKNDLVIRIWELDYDVLLGKSTSAKSIIYTNAKVVLMGEASAGKTCIAKALLGEPFFPQESTHGMKVWIYQSSKKKSEGGEIIRETFLWDLAGQTDYQVIHQLFLDGTALGIILFDPIHPENPFGGVAHWEKALRKTAGDDCPKLLVAGRVDRGHPTVTDDEIHAFLKEHGFIGFIATSAKTREGVDKLHEAIRKSIPWDSLPVTRSPKLWKNIRGYLLKRRKGKSVMTRREDLIEAFRKKTREEFSDEDFNTVISHAQAQGLVWRFSFGDFILLKPEILNNYASVIVLAARKNPKGLGSVCEQEVLQAAIDFEDIQRPLDPATELSLLHAVVELFIDRQIAFRESGQLVFPSKLNRQRPQYTNFPTCEVAYLLEGSIENVYATLVVRLFYSGAFELKYLWKDAVEFLNPMGQICGFILTCSSEGCGTISVFFEDQTSLESKLLFMKFINEQLLRHTLTEKVKRVRIYRCSNCGEEVEDKRAVEIRLKKGKGTITCQYCDKKIPLIDRLEEKLGDPELLEKVRNMEKDANERKVEAVGITKFRAKADIGEFDVFLVHNNADKEQVIAISERLKTRGINPWLDSEQIPPGRWFQDIIEKIIPNVKSAAIIMGKKGIGKWQTLELRTFISQCVEKDIPVIPILLPGVTQMPPGLLFLKELNCVFFKDNIAETEAIDNLEWGITGEKPRRKQNRPSCDQKT